MATVAKYRVGETLRAIAFPLDLGNDPVTGEARTIAETDAIAMVMRNRNALTPTAQTRDITVLTDGPYTINGTDYDTICFWKPEDGDFDEAGTYDLVFTRTNSDEDIEIIPPDRADDYQFIVGLKPGDTAYDGPA